MGKDRAGHLYAQLAVLKSKRGVALINALVFSLMIGLLITGLYIAINTLFKSTEEMRTFTSVREAAASGARYAASMAPYFPKDSQCETYELEFNIAGRQGKGNTTVVMCRISQVSGSVSPGEKTGASYEPVYASAFSGGKGIFKIVSEARFNEQVSRVEAVYVRE